MSENSTVVLVHGAFADASGFGGVIRELSDHTVIAPPNPLRGLASDAAALAAVVGAIDGPVVLVGHSYGGAVITQASAGLANVTRAGLCRRVRPGCRRELRECAGPVPALAVGEDVVSDLLRRPGRRAGTRPLHQPRAVPADVLRGRPGRRSRRHVGHPASAVAGRADRERHRGGLADQAVLVPGFRAGQRDPAGRRAVHGEAHERDHRDDHRLAHRFHRAAVAVAAFIRRALAG